MKDIKLEAIQQGYSVTWENLYTGERFGSELDVRREAVKLRRRADYLDLVADHIREESE